MKNTSLAIATITLARDEAEEKLLRASLPLLADLGVPVFVTDGGSGPDFISFLNQLPNVRLSAASVKGVWSQAHNSLREAHLSGAASIIYTEPDKLHFFENFLPGLINKKGFDPQKGITLFSRSVKGFSSFPAFQQLTETTINQCCGEVMKQTVDYTYGPFVLHRELVPYLSLLQEDTGWGWRPFMFNVAVRLGYGLDAYVDDFMCPPDQQEDIPHERLYRMRQLSQNIQGLLLSTKIDLKHP